ncbi:MAG: PQQ-binding-like beta-propeller repeat protein [Propionibacteriaceae bacterium]|jgi:outer membrane protein assembly factor BamB|nr:PQQ-binding-like beta-propeller repeat protein [Propionibacteriaceae bacterium]
MAFDSARAPRKLAAAALGLALLAGCTAPDTVTPGVREHSPAAVPQPSYDPQTDPEKLYIEPADLPIGQEVGEDAGWYTRPMTGSDGEYKWAFLDAAGNVLADAAAGLQPDAADPSSFTAFGAGETYTSVPGVLTFRGNNYRDAPAYGTADVVEKKLEIVWTQEIGEVRGDGSYWPGAGWTGQPLLVNWPAETREAMGFDAEFAQKDLVEVIYPVFEGKVYRLDLETGKQTKEPIDSGCGFKGTGSVDPRGYPLLYAGQGLNDMDDDEATDDCPFRYRIFDLIQNKEVSGWEGTDPAAPRLEPEGWGAFDSSALVNAASDTLIEPAENGLIYKAKLNASFDAATKTVSVNPELTRMEYQTPVTAEYGLESSAVAYRNLVYASDNDGNLLCWDATTMAVYWVRDVGDDSDASMVLEETDDGVFLYHGNTLDKRGKEGGSGELVTNLRKIDALTGEIVWEFDVPTSADYPNNGGLLATPLLGKGEISDMVIFNVSKTNSTREGDMYALDKLTGEVIWRRHFGRYSWSSPIAITGSDGHQYGIVSDSGGTMHLFDPNTGEDYSTISLGKNVEASPAAFGNMLVVASYDKKIFGIRIS